MSGKSTFLKRVAGTHTFRDWSNIGCWMRFPLLLQEKSGSCCSLGNCWDYYLKLAIFYSSSHLGMLLFDVILQERSECEPLMSLRMISCLIPMVSEEFYVIQH